MKEKETDYMKVSDVTDGRFWILGKLRKGGFGQIYKVSDIKAETGISLNTKLFKIKHPKFHSNPRCPKLFGSGTLGKCQFLATQLLGKSLRNYVVNVNFVKFCVTDQSVELRRYTKRNGQLFAPYVAKSKDESNDQFDWANTRVAALDNQQIIIKIKQNCLI